MPNSAPTAAATVNAVRYPANAASCFYILDQLVFLANKCKTGPVMLHLQTYAELTSRYDVLGSSWSSERFDVSLLAINVYLLHDKDKMRGPLLEYRGPAWLGIRPCHILSSNIGRKIEYSTSVKTQKHISRAGEHHDTMDCSS